MSALTTPDPPTLDAVLRRAIARALAQMRVAGPARVESFDRKRRTVKVKPLICRPGREGATSEEPAIGDVPVLWPGTKTHRIRFPLAVDDMVLLVHLDLASDDWALGLLLPQAVKPRPVAPAEVRSHDYTDVVAIPLSTFAPALSAELLAGTAPMDDRIVIENGNAQLALIDGGKVALGVRVPGGAAVELLALFDDLLTLLQTSVVDSIASPSLGAAAQAALLLVKTKLATIKGSL